MWQIIKRSLWIWLLVSGLRTCWAYSPGGPIGNGVPGDSWQTPVIGYGLGGDLNAPKNLGEEYRRNTPVMYYTYDANFLDFFGSNGVAAVDSAFTVLNALTNVDSYSTALSEFPFESRHLNYTAQALGLYDLKSFTLGAMIEQLGLADPIRYDWTLHDRAHIAGLPACPVGMEYLVVQRNFDPIGSTIAGSSTVSTPYSPYVNNILYSYQILEFCTGPDPLALSVPFAVNPLADTYSPVASSIGGYMYAQTPLGPELTFVDGIDSYGSFYSGLTRDDVAGLRYLLSTNNINWETPAPGALVVTTNLAPTIVLTSSNLTPLLQASQTIDPALLPGLFPGVVVATSSNYWTIVVTTNYTSYINNPNGSPYGYGTLVTVPVVSTNFQQLYSTTFANIVTNGNLTNTANIIVSPGIVMSYYPTSVVSTVTTALVPATGQPYPPPPQTNTTSKTTILNVPSGEYLVLPPGACGFKILQEIPSATVYTTNVITAATNANGFVDTVSTVTAFTPHQFLVQPIDCTDVAPSPGLFEGIGNIKFVRADYDSLLGQYWQPVTNNYTMATVTNGHAVTLQFQRILTQPDFLFSAQDITSPNPPVAPPLFGVGDYIRNLNFNQANILPNLAGPGTITTPTTIGFNKVGPVYYNDTAFPGDVMDGTPYFTESPGGDQSDLYYGFYFLWASFDGTTNDPVVYPNGTSIANLENEVLTQISPTSLPTLASDVFYANIATFTATGGGFTAPFTWSASGLPDGLTLSSNGTLSGTPTQSGTFDFTLMLTDYVGRSGQWNYTITIQ